MSQVSIPDVLVQPAHASEMEAGSGTRLLRSAVLRAQLLRLALRGLTAKQSSEILRCSYFSARQHYRDPAFRAQVLSRVEGAMAYADERFDQGARTLHERLATTSEKAFEILQEMLVAGDDAGVTPGLRVKIAQDLMDRNPELTAVRKTENRNYNFNAEELARAAGAAREMEAAGPNVIPIAERKRA